MFVSYNNMQEDLCALYPGWPLSFSTPSPPMHQVTPIGGTGLGLVATRDIAAGETIVRERPYIVQPAYIMGSGGAEDIYRTLEGFVSLMKPENRRGVYALRNSKGSALPTELAGIVDTNSQEAGPFPNYAAQYTGVARDISRANHSCNPNTHPAFDTPTLTYSLHALRPIRAGEEITITYLGNTLDQHHERQQELRELYGFTCTCKICRLTGPERRQSDMARFALQLHRQKIAEHDARFAKWVLGGAELLPLDTLEPHDFDIFTLDTTSWSIMESEEYCEPSLWEPVLARLVKGCSVLEDEKEVRFYATKAAELRTAYTGSDGGWRAVAENPRQTDWWAKLGDKRKK
ncbi:SET domain-containing protein [Lentinus brumalis]|uniref:SET domain-containing protein n=1 Tax=Lentinus brumalis TaxID=2498619 RepID=A0A371D3P0_9APHY|nr:SET domain-containing protein [Polyporus brumalis]